MTLILVQLEIGQFPTSSFLKLRMEYVWSTQDFIRDMQVEPKQPMTIRFSAFWGSRWGLGRVRLNGCLYTKWPSSVWSASFRANASSEAGDDDMRIDAY